MNKYQLEKVVSGGQTGIDQLGLKVAGSPDIPIGKVAFVSWYALPETPT